jgi:hypothetical protein
MKYEAKKKIDKNRIMHNLWIEEDEKAKRVPASQEPR